MSRAAWRMIEHAACLAFTDRYSIAGSRSAGKVAIHTKSQPAGVAQALLIWVNTARGNSIEDVPSLTLKIMHFFTLKLRFQYPEIPTPY